MCQQHIFRIIPEKFNFLLQVTDATLEKLASLQITERFVCLVINTSLWRHISAILSYRLHSQRCDAISPEMSFHPPESRSAPVPAAPEIAVFSACPVMNVLLNRPFLDPDKSRDCINEIKCCFVRIFYPHVLLNGVSSICKTRKVKFLTRMFCIETNIIDLLARQICMYYF